MSNTEEKISNNKDIIEAIVGLLFNLLFYFLLNKYYSSVPFLKEDFVKVLPLYNLSIMVSIFIQASRVIFRNRIYKTFGEIVSMFFFAVIAYQLWIVFPFDLSWFSTGSEEQWNILFRFLIVVPPILAIFGTVVSFIKILIEESK